MTPHDLYRLVVRLSPILQALSAFLYIVQWAFPGVKALIGG